MSSPIEALSSPLLEQRGMCLLVKRDDLLHPFMGGNKWRKLKHNLDEARRLGKKSILTWGGAYSNHIAAVATAGKEFGFSTTGIIRGERCGLVNPTLRYVEEECGMELRFVSRTNFRTKSQTSMLEALEIDPEAHFLLPEGGANHLGMKGCTELPTEVQAQLGFLPDYFLVPCGTGTTLAGIAAGLPPGRSKALGISVLKGDFMENEVARLLCAAELQFGGSGSPPTWGSAAHNWQVLEGYHFGGYAKVKPELISFIRRFREEHGIPLDPVYTGKLFYAIFDLAEKGFFAEGSTLLAVHTGGLQGMAGFNERFPKYALEVT